MRKVFYAYALNDHTDSEAEAFLNLPASPYEMLDAMDKLRLSEGSNVKFRIDEYYRFGCLVPFLSEPNDLYALNALAQKLSELDEQQEVAFEGLLAIEIRTKEAPIELPDLIDLAYSTECCHVVGEALNDSQLGRFCAENGFVPGVDNLPDAVFDMLDFERIGREHRQREGGILIERTADHPGGYVERHSDLVEAYKTLDLTPKVPKYSILLRVSKRAGHTPGHGSDRNIQLKLPADPGPMDTVLDALDIRNWREAGWDCLDCRVPSLADAISKEYDIHTINDMAQRISDLEPEPLAVYKALLSAVDCQDFRLAEQLIGTLDEYILSPQVSSPIEVAKEDLSVILCDGEREQITPYLNLYKYGRELIQDGGGAMTEYGLLERKDGQPVQAMERQPQWGGMEMR